MEAIISTKGKSMRFEQETDIEIYEQIVARQEVQADIDANHFYAFSQMRIDQGTFKKTDGEYGVDHGGVTSAIAEEFRNTYNGKFSIHSDNAKVRRVLLNAIKAIGVPATSTHFETIKDLEAKEQEISLRIIELQDSYSGWTRWEVCHGGHLHDMTNHNRCSSLDRGVNMSHTSWIPAFAAMQWDEVAEELSADTIVCSICFPDAPVEYRESREEPKEKPLTKAEEKALKQAIVEGKVGSGYKLHERKCVDSIYDMKWEVNSWIEDMDWKISQGYGPNLWSLEAALEILRDRQGLDTIKDAIAKKHHKRFDEYIAQDRAWVAAGAYPATLEYYMGKKEREEAAMN